MGALLCHSAPFKEEKMRKFWIALGVLFLTTGISPAQQPICITPAGQNVACAQQGLGNAGYPPGATPFFQSATGTTAGTTATAAGVAGQFTYLTGWAVSPGAATGAITITITSTGLGSNNINLSVGAPVAAAGTTANIQQAPQIGPGLRSTAVNTAISLTAGALGAGGVNQAVNIWGYYQ